MVRQSKTPSLLFVLMMSLQFVWGKKILLLSINTPSHFLQLGAIGDALIQRGHQASLVVHSGTDVPSTIIRAGIKIIRFNTTDEVYPMETEDFQQRIIRLSTRGSPVELTKSIMSFAGSEALDFIKNEDLMTRLRAEKFDFSLVDGFQLARHLFVIPHRLKLPYAVVTPIFNYDLFPLTLQIPWLLPCQVVAFSASSTFFNRLKTVVVSFALTTVVSFAFDEEAMKEVCEEPFESLRALAMKSHIWLLDLDDMVDVPKPLPPNVFSVGGLSTGPSQPLEGEFKRYADEATDGLIVITFGGTIGYLPQEYLDRILVGLGLVKYKVIIRQKTKPSVEVPANVRIVPWLPQNDLLGHPNTKLFITHCGSNGQHEAVYHGVPMLGLPVLGDQVYNAVRFTAKGYGTWLKIETFKPTDLAIEVNHVIETDSYRKTIQKASRIFRSRPMRPREKAAFWIEHVMEFGSDHLESYTTQLSWYQILLLDVLCFIFILLLISMCLLRMCIKFILARCCRKPTKQKQN